jgi:cytidylate kinase
MSLSKLIEKQLLMWEIKKRLANADQQPGRYVGDGVAYGPCLLVSRECGSGGGQIARQAGERLGWNVYDRELVEQIAQVAHERRRLIESVDEHVRSYWDELLTNEGVTTESYLQYLLEVVMSLGHHGEVVIMGRGAHYLLPSGCALRVRVVAPLELRAKRLADHEALSFEQARTKVQRVDAERAAFIRRTFRKNVESPLCYDLVINSGEIAFGSATDLVLTALEKKLGVKAAHLSVRSFQHEDEGLVASVSPAS